MHFAFMNASKFFDYESFLDAFKDGILNSIYLVKTGTMTYSGVVRSVDTNSIIMDLPLKFYSGNNVMYTPVIIGKEEVEEIKEIPVEGHITVTTKNEGVISGYIEKAFSNRIVIDREDETHTVYYQDMVMID
jgi:hypothetical protein